MSKAFLIAYRAGLHLWHLLREWKPAPYLFLDSKTNRMQLEWFLSKPEQTGCTNSRMTVSEFSNSHWRHQGWEGHSSCMVRHVHTHTFTHRCSLFSQAAINLHAWGYESIGGRKRERLEVREGLFKVNRGEQVSFFWSDLLNWQPTPLSHA